MVDYDRVISHTLFKEYRYKNILHRIGGPAVINHGRILKCKWYRFGLLHRENGPADIGETYKLWYLDGRAHREDGPAIIYLRNATEKGWAFKGVLFSIQKEWFEFVLIHKFNVGD